MTIKADQLRFFMVFLLIGDQRQVFANLRSFAITLDDHRSFAACATFFSFMNS
jgi:hypothetical protein